MPAVFNRLQIEGFTPGEIADETQHPLEFVLSSLNQQIKYH